MCRVSRMWFSATSGRGGSPQLPLPSPSCRARPGEPPVRAAFFMIMTTFGSARTQKSSRSWTEPPGGGAGWTRGAHGACEVTPGRNRAPGRGVRPGARHAASTRNFGTLTGPARCSVVPVRGRCELLHQPRQGQCVSPVGVSPPAVGGEPGTFKLSLDATSPELCRNGRPDSFSSFQFYRQIDF